MVFFIFFIFLISGCVGDKDDNVAKSTDTVYYSLNISKFYSERITFPFTYVDYNNILKSKTKNSTYVTSKELLINYDVEPIGLSSKKYFKEIHNDNDNVNLVLSYDYLESEFLKEGYIEKCFENYDLKGTDDYFEISLSGNYRCRENFSKLVINISNSNYVIETNGEENKGGYYWIIDDNNYNNVDVHYKFSRDYNSMATKIENEDLNKKRIFGIVKFILIIVVVAILHKIYNKYKVLDV